MHRMLRQIFKKIMLSPKDHHSMKGHPIQVQNHHRLKSQKIGNLLEFSKNNFPAETSKLNSEILKTLYQGTMRARRPFEMYGAVRVRNNCCRNHCVLTLFYCLGLRVVLSKPCVSFENLHPNFWMKLGDASNRQARAQACTQWMRSSDFSLIPKNYFTI